MLIDEVVEISAVIHAARFHAATADDDERDGKPAEGLRRDAEIYGGVARRELPVGAAPWLPPLRKERARHVHEQRRRTDLRPISDEIERDKRDVIPLMFGEVLLTIIHQWPLLFRSLSVPAPPYGPSGHVQPFERRPHLPLGRGFRFPISPRAFVLRVPLDERGDHLARPPF